MRIKPTIKSTQLALLQPSIEVSYGLECAQCGGHDLAPSADSRPAAAREFHDDGWRVVEGELRCPRCVQAGEESDD